MAKYFISPECIFGRDLVGSRGNGLFGFLRKRQTKIVLQFASLPGPQVLPVVGVGVVLGFQSFLFPVGVK